MEEINEIIAKILSGAQESISNQEWDTFTINVYALNKMIEINSFYENEDQIISFDSEDSGVDITMESKNLREKMYRLSSEQGAWFSASFVVNNEGDFNTHFDYNRKPKFTYEPSKEKYIDDIKKFPRQESLMPNWLKEILLF